MTAYFADARMEEDQEAAGDGDQGYFSDGGMDDDIDGEETEQPGSASRQRDQQDN